MSSKHYVQTRPTSVASLTIVEMHVQGHKAQREGPELWEAI